MGPGQKSQASSAAFTKRLQMMESIYDFKEDFAFPSSLNGKQLVLAPKHVVKCQYCHPPSQALSTRQQRRYRARLLHLPANTVLN